MKIENQYSLLKLNTLAIKAKAQYAVKARNTAELLDGIEFAKKNNVPIKILGGGSNVVLADYIPGLVLMFIDQSCEILNETNEQVKIRVGAGYNWHKFVMNCLSRGWYGLENLAYIPGTVGAAPVQNIGAYGVEVKELISSVNGMYLESGELFNFKAPQCEFAYRESCFKQALNGKVVITSVEFTLSKVAQVNVSYAPLGQMAKDKGVPTPLDLANWVIKLRQSKLPDPEELPNAGSFFKNPVVSQSEFRKLIKIFPEMPNYPQGEDIKLAAGWLIDQLGLKGKSFGAVRVHDQQALVLVNQGGTGVEVLDAAKKIKRAVYDGYGIELEQEPRIFN